VHRTSEERGSPPSAAASSVDTVAARKREVVERHGEWTGHNIHLGGGVYTIGEQVRVDDVVARRILQAATDVLGRPLAGARVLDLGCLEGLYAIEFARHGADVLGVEVREANIAKARFAKETLGIDNLEFVKDDVRNLSSERYGSFDVVLCLGILYHLDAPDLFRFVHQMADVTRRCLIIDTHISHTAKISIAHEGKEYWGRFFNEHPPEATAEEKEKAVWASIDNPRSVWLTRESLYDLLAHAGFTSVYECHNPPVPQRGDDRLTFVAIKGTRQEYLSAPLLDATPDWGWPELTWPAPASIRARARARIGRALPASVRKVVKRRRS
jgi:2-polyprenyl-3-methyl-5-hydroxy-6-metoxy-1,4-benzoquinol methylase